MKARFVSLGVLFLALFLHGAPVRAQQPGHLLPTLQTAKGPIKPGTWVQYTIFNRRSKETNSVRIAALGREGKQGRWVEIAITDARHQTLVFKALVEGGLAQPRRVLKTVIQPPGHQPVEIPAKDSGKIKLPRMSTKPDPGSRLVGKGKVKVAGGTFTAVHYRSTRKGEVTDIWSSDQVPGWPMIKAETPEVVLELSGHGTGARSQIRGTPGKLDPKLLEQLQLRR